MNILEGQILRLRGLAFGGRGCGSLLGSLLVLQVVERSEDISHDNMCVAKIGWGGQIITRLPLFINNTLIDTMSRMWWIDLFFGDDDGWCSSCLTYGILKWRTLKAWAWNFLMLLVNVTGHTNMKMSRANAT